MSKLIIEDRICPKCNGNIWNKNKIKSNRQGIYKKEIKQLFVLRCVKCTSDYRKTDKFKETYNKWFEKNKEKVSETKKKRKATPEGKKLYLARRKRYREKSKKELRRSYIIKLLGNFFRKHNIKFDSKKISDEDINKFKEILKIKRELKNGNKKEVKAN